MQTKWLKSLLWWVNVTIVLLEMEGERFVKQSDSALKRDEELTPHGSVGCPSNQLILGTIYSHQPSMTITSNVMYDELDSNLCNENYKTKFVNMVCFTRCSCGKIQKDAAQ